MSKFANAGPTSDAAAAAPPPPPPAYGAAAMVDLVDEISWSGCEVLNAAKKESLGNALKQGLRDQELMIVESDADEQLLINIAFTSRVKVHSMEIAGPGGRAPKNVKLFANRTGLGFDDCESAVAEQELDLEPEKLGERIELKFVKFQAVDKLTVFIGSNQDDEESTALSLLRFWGTSVSTTKMGDFKRVAGHAGEGE